jgi:hypothetical protein
MHSDPASTSSLISDNFDVNSKELGSESKADGHKFHRSSGPNPWAPFTSEDIAKGRVMRPRTHHITEVPVPGSPILRCMPSLPSSPTLRHVALTTTNAQALLLLNVPGTNGTYYRNKMTPQRSMPNLVLKADPALVEDHCQGMNRVRFTVPIKAEFQFNEDSSDRPKSDSITRKLLRSQSHSSTSIRSLKLKAVRGVRDTEIWWSHNLISILFFQLVIILSLSLLVIVFLSLNLFFSERKKNGR